MSCGVEAVEILSGAMISYRVYVITAQERRDKASVCCAYYLEPTANRGGGVRVTALILHGTS